MMEFKNIKINNKHLSLEEIECEGKTWIYLKLNNVPIILLEKVIVDSKEKLLIKHYHSDDTHIDDDFIDYDFFGIEEE